MMKKKSKLLFYVFAVTSSLCIICIVAAIATEASENSSKAKTTNDYMDEFGGNPDVYARILSSTDCAALQNEFDQAEENLQEPGTPQYRWGLGYMKASDDRMREIGCYETKQIPIEQVIIHTAAAAQTQTYAAASPISSFTPFEYTTPSAFFQPTLAPTWTPFPTETPFIISIPTQPAGSGGAVCSCSEDTLSCKDFSSQNAAQACYNHCVANGYGDVHRLDQGGETGVVCEDYDY